jgi:thiol-disulfide isomerase/thioredoxin
MKSFFENIYTFLGRFIPFNPHFDRKYLVTLVTIFLALGITTSQLNNNRSNPAKELVLNDVMVNTLDGVSVSLQEITNGKPAVINSWATWCPFCTKELGDFAELQKNNPDVIVIAINRRESNEKNLEYLNETNLADSLLFLLDEDDKFYKSIGGFAIPETIFVNSDGTIETHKRGPMNIDEMQLLLEKIK